MILVRLLTSMVPPVTITYLSYNKASALGLHNCKIVMPLETVITFHRNSGLYGGAVPLNECSYLFCIMVQK